MSQIETRDVTYFYKTEAGTVPVLHSLNLKIEAGDFVAIQGPSGSGKSTLLYLLGGLLRLQKGHVLIDGQDLTKLSAENLALFRNKKIGFVFQQFHLLARSSVMQNILLPTQYPSEFRESQSQDTERAMDLAKSLGLGDRLEHTPNQLSGGQQQRVAIARALINDPEIILADEPTGNLDSQSSKQIMDLLADMNKEGRTVVVITHDNEVAARCKKIIRIRDGQVFEVIENEISKKTNFMQKSDSTVVSVSNQESSRSFATYLRLIQKTLPIAVENLKRNKVRTVLTMLGIIIGIASVLSMVTLGQFTKERVLDSYADLGVNTIMFYGYPNWSLKATDVVKTAFRSFDPKNDIEKLPIVFKDILKIAPSLRDGGLLQASFAGKSVDNDIRLVGTTAEGLEISKREILVGRTFSQFHIEQKSSVCLIGYELAEKLFTDVSPIGQVLYITKYDSSIGCKVIGVLKKATSSKEFEKPNLQVMLPYTYFQATTDSWWTSQIHDVLIQVNPKIDISKYAENIKGFFELRYGNSGRFSIDSNSVLIAQMNKFLNMFTGLLAFIAFMSLVIGGVGIANMMLVSVSERYREIGLRKAIGATDFSVRIQFLTESLVICSIAGFIGLTLGFTLYELLIFAGTKVIAKLEFEWIINWDALLLSLGSILIVGVLSGLYPAVRAEQLQVIDALRSD